jgi:hypothetical protein
MPNVSSVAIDMTFMNTVSGISKARILAFGTNWELIQVSALDFENNLALYQFLSVSMSYQVATVLSGFAEVAEVVVPALP